MGKIGVYGRSLGGIPSAHLSSSVSMSIVDRSFGNFNDMAKFKFQSRAAEWFFKIGSCGWQVQSDYSFVKKSEVKTLKVILQDKQDEIVHINASLMLGIAKTITNK